MSVNGAEMIPEAQADARGRVNKKDSADAGGSGRKMIEGAPAAGGLSQQRRVGVQRERRRRSHRGAA